MTTCILNPKTNRCVLKNGKVGQEIIKQYGERSDNNCIYDQLTNRCILQKSNKTPIQSIAISEISPRGMKHIDRIASGVKLSNSLKGVHSNNCNILDILNIHGFKIKKIESLSKKSASETVIIKLTTDKGVELLAKIGYQMRNVKLDELFAENFIYKFLNKFNLPFIVEYVKQFTCPNINAFLSQFPRDISNQLDDMYIGPETQRGFNILLTKMCSDKCKTLHDLLQTRPDPKDANAILLQCMYTLTYFEEIGLQHNDLHLGNIFVEENPSNISLKFNDKITFNFSSKYLVKIYDFDFSSIVPTKFNYNTYYPNGRNNEYVETQYCISNKSNYGKRDTAQLLLNYSRSYNNKLLQLLVSLCLPKDLIIASVAEALPHPGHPCKLKNYKFEIFPNIKSAKTAMLSFPIKFALNVENYLNLPDEDLNLIRPILPSLAQNCNEYTEMTDCIKPVKPVASLERKKKFSKAVIKTAKLI